jgi:dTMP kinase
VDATSMFITVEGIDGAGKSTHVPWLAEVLASSGRMLRVTREPGGTALGERLREVLLQPGQQVDPLAEALLMFAARQEHLARVIRPALAAGQWVLCDRFTDATFAYQGCGRELDSAKLEVLERLVHADLQPDLTLLFDTSLDVAMERLAQGKGLDRFEREQRAFFERVRAGYLARAQRYAHRFAVVDGDRPIDSVRDALMSILRERGLL